MMVRSWNGFFWVRRHAIWGIQYVLSVQATLVLKKLQNQNKYDSIYVVTEKGKAESAGWLGGKTLQQLPCLFIDAQIVPEEPETQAQDFYHTQKFSIRISGRKICICAADLCFVFAVWQQIFNEFTGTANWTEPNRTELNWTELNRVKGPRATRPGKHSVPIQSSFDIQNTFGKYWYPRKLFKMRNIQRQ